MELTCTDRHLKELFVLKNAEYEASVGKENTFTLKVAKELYSKIKDGFILCSEDENSGGQVTTALVSSTEDTVTFEGRTWHGVLEDLTVVANKNFNNITVSEAVNSSLTDAGLNDFFVMSATTGIIENIRVSYGTSFLSLINSLINNGLNVRFRYDSVLGKLCIVLEEKKIVTDDILSSEHFKLTVEKTVKPFTEIISINDNGSFVTAFLQQDGTIADKQSFKGIDRRVYVYYSNDDYTSVCNKLKDMLLCDTATIELINTDIANAQDTVAALEEVSGVYVEAIVADKIIRNQRGFTMAQYITEGKGI